MQKSGRNAILCRDLEYRLLFRLAFSFISHESRPSLQKPARKRVSADAPIRGVQHMHECASEHPERNAGGGGWNGDALPVGHFFSFFSFFPRSVRCNPIPPTSHTTPPKNHDASKQGAQTIWGGGGGCTQKGRRAVRCFFFQGEKNTKGKTKEHKREKEGFEGAG